MKKIKFYLFAVISVALILCHSCQKAPHADFTYTKSLKLGYSANFVNTSIDGDSYYWEFGDGETSTNVSPAHTYTAAGTYKVTLTSFFQKWEKKF